ncbi:oligopeptidase A [Moraxella macacae 0408225]|uniref:oligopeptidase A n=1 Tax=Moraxella macacae 0408225 TaxID=1230338 RepID=L2FB05_9GAMM|nr:M3 family metallopeptidase [Moraxella macacae]ELA09618.1 oligopeptidase A [Moraxella macacae 0408225]
MPNKNLHLVNFNQLKLEQLQQHISDSLENGHAFLAMLNDEPVATTSQHALNDIIAFEHVNIALDRSWGLLSHLNSVVSSDEIRTLHHKILPNVSEYGTKVGQNQVLFSRYRHVIEDKDFFNQLEPARQRALHLAMQGFELSGVALDEDKKEKFAKLVNDLSTLSAKFSDNLLDATQSYFLPLLDNQLSGLPQSALAMLKDAGVRYHEKFGKTQSTYVATLDIPVYLAVMTYADDRGLREKLYRAYVTRASEHSEQTQFNNANIMTEILAKREQKAKLLGFDNFAQVSLATKMAKDVATVEQFLTDLAKKAMPYAKADLKILETEGLAFEIDELKPWDTAYLAEKVRERKFNLSQEALRPYFPLPKVIDGLFRIVQRLYGIFIVEKTDDVERWHEDVRFYQLFDENQTLIGGFYFDLYARTGKRSGAWMSGFQARYQNTQHGYHQLPVCFMVANFTPAIDNKPSLLTHDEVLTLFHEFGHGLHHLLTEVSISDVAGVNGVEWDAVELPSQFMENWAWHADSIALISGHVDTGEPLPAAMLQSMLNAKHFQNGMQTLRQIEFALFDLLLHATTPAPDYEGLLTLLNQVRSCVAIMPTTDYNRFANSFSHIFAGGYASGYYSYKWAELLSADAFAKFEQEGIFNPNTGKQFREQVLAKGASRTAQQNFEAFRERPADIEALLRHSGFYEELLSDDVTNSQSW